MNDQFETLLTAKQTAEILNVSEMTLANSRSTGRGINPPYVKLSNKAIRYRLSDLEEYIENNTFNNTGEAKEESHD